MSDEISHDPPTPVPDEEAGKAMHVHKPKAPHGLREFLTEIGVIVIGIVIALGGEQAVEWLHWRATVAETREALDSELARDLGVVQARIDQQPCIARRLDELRALFVTHAKGQKVALARPFGQPQFPHIETNVWDTALTGQGAAQIPVELRLRYAAVYDALRWFQEKTTEQEAQAWSHLSVIDDYQVLNEADWSSLHQWTANARVLSDKIAANLRPDPQSGKSSLTVMTTALGIKPLPYKFRPGSQAAQDAFCRPAI